MKHPDAEKLAGILREIKPVEMSVALSDLFAVGCYLHMKGEQSAGLKVCQTVLRAIGYSNRKTYFVDLISSIPGNERLLSSQVEAHTEVANLFIEGRSDSHHPIVGE